MKSPWNCYGSKLPKKFVGDLNEVENMHIRLAMQCATAKTLKCMIRI